MRIKEGSCVSGERPCDPGVVGRRETRCGVEGLGGRAGLSRCERSPGTFFAILAFTSCVSSLICCWSETLGAAVEELEDELEEEDEEAEDEEVDVAGCEGEEEVEFGGIDDEVSSIFIPSSELAHEVEVEALEDDVDLLFLEEGDGFKVTSA